jgi:aconitate hydratase
VQVDEFGKADSLENNVQIEFDRNIERYGLPALGPEGVQELQGRAAAHRHRASGQSRIPRPRRHDRAEGRRTWAFPDTVFGTDSHTTMINGIGVLGWGVGGIEAEAAMLGQPSSMLIPQVVGFKLTGKLP